MRTAANSPVDHRQERGSGLLGSAIAIAVVIGLLGFAVNISLGLWARSTVDAVAYDAARRVATSDSSSPSSGAADVESTAIADARAVLGDFGSKVQMNFVHDGDPDRVVLHLRAPGISLLPRLLKGGPIVGAIDREIVIRREGK